MSESMNLSLGQVRAARAMLGWTQNDLAYAAALGSSTVADFERGARLTSEEAVMAMRAALEDAGIEFILCGVKLKPFCERWRTRSGWPGPP